jgi:hypothetical protein
MARVSSLSLLLALCSSLPVAAHAISVTGSTSGTLAGSASSSAPTSGNSSAPTPTRFQFNGIITNVDSNAGTFQINGATMTLASGAAVIGSNGQPLSSLAQINSGQTVQVTLTEVKTGDPTTGPRTAYAVRVIR